MIMITVSGPPKCGKKAIASLISKALDACNVGHSTAFKHVRRPKRKLKLLPPYKMDLVVDTEIDADTGAIRHGASPVRHGEPLP